MLQQIVAEFAISKMTSVRAMSVKMSNISKKPENSIKTGRKKKTSCQKLEITKTVRKDPFLSAKEISEKIYHY